MFKIVVLENTVLENWPFTWRCPNFMNSEIRRVILSWVMVAFPRCRLGIKEVDVQPCHFWKLIAGTQNPLAESWNNPGGSNSVRF